MYNNRDNRNFKINKLLTVVILILIAGFAGWLLGRGNDTSNNNSTNSNPADMKTANTPPNISSVNSLVTYSLPDGWEETDCENTPGSVYVIPAGANDVDCGANPSSPVKLSIDQADTKDCNELQNVTEVKKHVCISLFINDLRSLNATTEYLASSSYGQDTTQNTYYLDTGNGVIKAEYIFNSENQYQIGFDQLANSIKSK